MNKYVTFWFNKHEDLLDMKNINEEKNEKYIFNNLRFWLI